jgi:hypothetical protein
MRVSLSVEDVVVLVLTLSRRIAGLHSAGTQRWIANLGHGMHPDHDPAIVTVLIDAVREASSSAPAPAPSSSA